LYGMIAGSSLQSFAQEPYRVGTTAANFLEIGYGSAGSAMGDAYVSIANDLSATYWNPAGLAFMKQNEAQFTYQPWIAGIGTSFAGVGIVLPRYGTFALSMVYVGYGDMEVTNLEMQEGTGETFSPNDFAVSLSYSRKLAEWFSFGASAKYISSQIWHTSAGAAAVDLGVVVNTAFFSPTENREDGLTIGMSISNYGTKMKYDGMDLLNPIDILPDEEGNYRDVTRKFNLEGWELPLIFRIGFSIHPLVLDRHRLTLSVDALHPNNNSESVNVGSEYRLSLTGGSAVSLRAGYHGLFMDESVYGLTLGCGVELALIRNRILKMDYAYKSMDKLGNFSMFTLGATL